MIRSTGYRRKWRLARENLFISWGYGDWFSDSGRLYSASSVMEIHERVEKRPIRLIFGVKNPPRSRDSPDLRAT